MYRRYTDYDDAARQALVDAQAAAEERGHGHIGTEHLLLGLVRDPDGSGAQWLAGLGVDRALVLEWTDRYTRRGSDRPTGESILTPRTRRVLELAEMEARADASPAVTPVHLLRAIARERDGIAAQVLASLGVDLDRVQRRRR